MTPLWLHSGQGRARRNLPGSWTIAPCRKSGDMSPQSKVGATPYRLRRHDAALVAQWTGQSASELAGIVDHRTVQEKRRHVSTVIKWIRRGLLRSVRKQVEPLFSEGKMVRTVGFEPTTPTV
jgi:hypothetical protein